MATKDNEQQELYGVQMLRAIAALAVVTHHSLEESNGAQGRFSPDWLTTSGASGVDIFFVISGFIMLFVSFRPYRPPIGLRDFLFRRFTRIYPIYWICCLAMLFLSILGFMIHHRLNFYDIISSFILVPSTRPILGTSWTLIYEVYFYAIFSITLLFRSKLISVILTTLIIIGLILAGPLFPEPLRAFLRNPIVLEFCLGLWLAWAFSTNHRRSEAPLLKIDNQPLILGALCAFGFILITAAPLLVPHPNTNGLPGLSRILAWGLPAVLVAFTFLGVKKPTNWISRFAVLLGNASYALYLTHEFIMISYAKMIKMNLFSDIDQMIVVPFVVLICVGVALVTHLFIEQPLLALTRHLTRRRYWFLAKSPTAA